MKFLIHKFTSVLFVGASCVAVGKVADVPTLIKKINQHKLKSNADKPENLDKIKQELNKHETEASKKQTVIEKTVIKKDESTKEIIKQENIIQNSQTQVNKLKDDVVIIDNKLKEENDRLDENHIIQNEVKTQITQIKKDLIDNDIKIKTLNVQITDISQLSTKLWNLATIDLNVTEINKISKNAIQLKDLINALNEIHEQVLQKIDEELSSLIKNSSNSKYQEKKRKQEEYINSYNLKIKVLQNAQEIFFQQKSLSEEIKQKLAEELALIKKHTKTLDSETFNKLDDFNMAEGWQSHLKIKQKNAEGNLKEKEQQETTIIKNINEKTEIKKTTESELNNKQKQLQSEQEELQEKETKHAQIQKELNEQVYEKEEKLVTIIFFENQIE